MPLLFMILKACHYNFTNLEISLFTLRCAYYNYWNKLSSLSFFTPFPLSLSWPLSRHSFSYDLSHPRRPPHHALLIGVLINIGQALLRHDRSSRSDAGSRTPPSFFFCETNSTIQYYRKDCHRQLCVHWQ